MHRAERQQLLAQRARCDGRADVMAVVPELEVTPEISVSLRDRTNSAEKERIVRTALGLLHPGAALDP